MRQRSFPQAQSTNGEFNHILQTSEDSSSKVGTVIDETGCVGAGQLVLSREAWEQLLGDNAVALIKGGTSKLESIEHHMLFMRVTLGFFWVKDVARLAVLEVLGQ